jgi:hypothetical protein
MTDFDRLVKDGFAGIEASIQEVKDIATAAINSADKVFTKSDDIKAIIKALTVAITGLSDSFAKHKPEIINRLVKVEEKLEFLASGLATTKAEKSPILGCSSKPKIRQII